MNATPHTFAVGMPRTAPLPDGRSALVEFTSTRLTEFEHDVVGPHRRCLIACTVLAALAFVAACGAPIVAAGREHAADFLPELGSFIAAVWFLGVLDPKAQLDVGVVRWPAATSILCAVAAFGAYLGDGRTRVVIWFALWAVPGLLQLVRYHIARNGLDAVAYTRQMMADAPTTGWPPPIPTH